VSEHECAFRHGRRTTDLPRRPRTLGSEHDVRVEHGEKRLEVTIAGSCKERIRHLPLMLEIGVWDGGAVHAAAGTARELPGRRGGAPHYEGDLVEGHRKHGVEHERKPL
jgi:hypothetical protein